MNIRPRHDEAAGVPSSMARCVTLFRGINVGTAKAVSTLPPKNLETPDDAALAPEMLRVGRQAIYQWMPNGSQSTKFPRAFWKQFAGA